MRLGWPVQAIHRRVVTLIGQGDEKFCRTAKSGFRCWAGSDCIASHFTTFFLIIFM